MTSRLPDNTSRIWALQEKNSPIVVVHIDVSISQLKTHAHQI